MTRTPQNLTNTASLKSEIRTSYEAYCNAWGRDQDTLARAWDRYYHTLWNRLNDAFGWERANRIILDAKAEAVCSEPRAKIITYISEAA